MTYIVITLVISLVLYALIKDAASNPKFWAIAWGMLIAFAVTPSEYDPAQTEGYSADRLPAVKRAEQRIRTPEERREEEARMAIASAKATATPHAFKKAVRYDLPIFGTAGFMASMDITGTLRKMKHDCYSDERTIYNLNNKFQREQLGEVEKYLAKCESRDYVVWIMHDGSTRVYK